MLHLRMGVLQFGVTPILYFFEMLLSLSSPFPHAARINAALKITTNTFFQCSSLLFPLLIISLFCIYLIPRNNFRNATPDIIDSQQHFEYSDNLSAYITIIDN